MSDITYEELIRLSDVPICMSNSSDVETCRTLPMRNWYSIHRAAAARYLLFRRTLPMRNWYIQQIMSSIITDILSSDITYEELIHVQPNLLCNICTDSCRTLPMRNWYKSPVWCSSTSNSVGHYLWGIDTSEITSDSWLVTSDITYEELILFCRFNICRENALSDITYEELIHFLWFNSFCLCLQAISRTLPMRNWYFWNILC